MNVTAIIGTFATSIAIFSFLPQVIRCYRTKSTRDIALMTYIILCVSASSWALYGLLQADFPVLFTNVVVFLMSLSIVTMKLLWG